ncbi:MAG: nitrous oxide reductase accessory protein NosL [Gammaproteobacteria bacterium]|nr:MAG: nitrous oxide reductase accessory protein NosL [Gammaproteobacteria bacterium]
MKQVTLRWLLAGIVVTILSACGDAQEHAAAKPAPVNFESGDECHVCGMAISGFPGPKGEAITESDQQVRKFCSTKDMFAWALQPENRNRNHTLYVHDMAQTQWASPDDTALIDAREAVYVVGADRMGAMGPTLASFAKKEDARSFVEQHGGEMLMFPDVTLQHLNRSMSGSDSGELLMESMEHSRMDSMDPE